MPDSPIEILGARERRRRWSVDEKLRIVAESHEPGGSVRAVAARHEVYPGLLHTWRRQVREGSLEASAPLRLLPVQLTPSQPELPAPPATSTSSNGIEICLPDGSRVLVGENASLKALRRVLSALRG
jgi:transposase